VRRVGGGRAQCSLNYGSNLIVADRPRSARANLVEQPITAMFQETTTPFADCVFVQAELCSNVFAG
jgi:hypothetical protein